MSARSTASRIAWTAWPLAAGLCALWAFGAVGSHWYDGWVFDLGSMQAPAKHQLRFFGWWSLLGSAAIAGIGLGLARLCTFDDRARRVGRVWLAGPDTTFLWLGALLGTLIPVILRSFVLHDQRLTDDESAYRFAAQLLADGHLYVPSPPDKLFFDRAFMVNDGHFYPQYFLGWPALMVPGVWLGVDGYMNALYAGLTVPAVFLVVKRLTDRGLARLGVVLYLASPMLMAGAATSLSHTSCLFALAWMTWSLLRSRDPGAPLWSHAGVLGFFALAFCIRPVSAVGVGLPLALVWLLGLRQLARPQLVRALLAGLAPALALAALFLLVNRLQNGGWLITAYQRDFEYARENGYRFSHWHAGNITKVAHFRFEDPLDKTLSRNAFALFRLNLSLFGWPFSLALVCLARLRRMGWLFLASALCYAAIHFFIFSPGIDTFGAAHYQEMAWPLLVLSVLGLAELRDLAGLLQLPGEARRTQALHLLPTGLVLAALLTAAIGYLPPELGALERMASAIALPQKAVEKAKLHKAIVFAPRPFIPRCAAEPSVHFVFWRPNNAPDLGDDVLWVNHITIEEDRRLLPHFPGRAGHVLVWNADCQPVLLPLQGLAPDAVPPARML